MMKKHKALSLVEILTAITIISVLASTLTLSPKIGRQTAKREAERIAAYLINLTHKFGSKRENFNIVLNDSNVKRGKTIVIKRTNNLYQKTVLDTFHLRDGCTFTYAIGNGLANTMYESDKNKFNNAGHITITDSEGAKHLVYIYSVGGRIRTSPNENED